MRHITKTILPSVSLASKHSLDLALLFLRRPHDQIVYYNLLFSIAIAIQPKVILELGTGSGTSSRAFIRALQYWSAFRNSDDTLLHTCDINLNAGQRLRRFGKLVKVHTMTTDELAVEWRKHETAIDLLYIDAAHSHEQSLRDFVNFSPYVIPRGIVLMHDTHPLTERHEAATFSGGVWKTAQIIKREYRSTFEISTIPALCGVSVIRKAGGKYF
jgi:predicted O-methyltransferase YrrM